MKTDLQKQWKRVRFWLVTAGTAILIIGVLMTVFGPDKKEDIRPQIQGSSLSNGEWTSLENGALCRISSFPYEVNEKKGIFFYQIPDEADTEDVLVLENRYQKVRVSVDGEEIYSYGEREGRQRFMPANIKCFIEMKPEYQGKVLEVEIEGWMEPLSIVLYEPQWSNDGSVVRDIITGNMAAAIFFIIVGIFGCVLVAASVIWAVRISGQYSENFASLGVFMLISAVWILTDSELLQLCVDNSQLILIVSFEAFFLMPVPFLYFLDKICVHDTNVFRWLRIVFILNCMIQNVIYLTGKNDFIHMVKVTHLIIFISIIYIVYYMMKEYIHYRLYYAKGVLIGIAGFACIAGVSIFIFYLNRGADDAFFFILGFALLMLDLFLMSVHKLRDMAESSVREKIYRELAFEDLLTGLGNRNLYEKWLERYDADRSGAAFSIAVMDINGLKQINDSYGHVEGDHLIQAGAECIRRTFQGIGECYRIGGDEFVVMMPDVELDVNLYRDKLKGEISRWNDGQEIELSIAVGFTVKKAGALCNGGLGELIEAADREMYREKNAKSGTVICRRSARGEK